MSVVGRGGANRICNAMMPDVRGRWSSGCQRSREGGRLILQEQEELFCVKGAQGVTLYER